MRPRVYKICTKKDVPGQDKPIWFRIGTITLFEESDKGNVVLNMMPDQKFFVFPKEDGDGSEGL